MEHHWTSGRPTEERRRKDKLRRGWELVGKRRIFYALFDTTYQFQFPKMAKGIEKILIWNLTKRNIINRMKNQ